MTAFLFYTTQYITIHLDKIMKANNKRDFNTFFWVLQRKQIRE